jgi:hypothetical protein
MAIKDSVAFTNLQSFDDDPGWVVRRYPFTDGSGGNIGQMLPGHLVKFNAGRTEVLAAVGAAGADDAVLEGVIVDIPDNTDVPLGAQHKTVAVALQGSFNKNNVKYQDGTALTTAAVARLRDMGIFLDPATPAGAFAP